MGSLRRLGIAVSLAVALGAGIPMVPYCSRGGVTCLEGVGGISTDGPLWFDLLSTTAAVSLVVAVALLMEATRDYMRHN